MRIATVLSFLLPSTSMAGIALMLSVALSSPTPPDGVSAQPIQAAFVDAGACVEAPTLPFGAPGLAGRATLCDDGQHVRTAVDIIGLPPGAEYTASWLDSGALPTACRETLCRLFGTPGDDPVASMQRITTASVQPSGVLELNGEIRDVRLVRGSQIRVQILGELGRAGPYAQANFIIP